MRCLWFLPCFALLYVGVACVPTGVTAPLAGVVLGTPLQVAAPTQRIGDAAGSSLYLGVLIKGTEYLCPVQDIWLYTTNKYLFIAKLKEKLASLMDS